MSREQLRAVKVSDFSGGVAFPQQGGVNPTQNKPGMLIEAIGCLATATGALGPGWDATGASIGGVVNDNWDSPNHRPSGGKQVLVDAVGWTDYLAITQTGSPVETPHTDPIIFRHYNEVYSSTNNGLYAYTSHLYHPGTVSPLTTTTNWFGLALPFLAAGGFLSIGRSKRYSAAGVWTSGVLAEAPFPVVVGQNVGIAASRVVFPNMLDTKHVLGNITNDEAGQWDEDLGVDFFGNGGTFHQEKYVWGNLTSGTFAEASPTDPEFFLQWMDGLRYNTTRLQGGWRDKDIAGLRETYDLHIGEKNEHIAWMVSINAQTLMVMTRAHGAYLVRGDLDYAQITHLAGAPIVATPFSLPCVTPQGIFYTTREGAFIINESGETVCVSPQLSEGCFEPSTPGVFNSADPKMTDQLPPWAPMGRCVFRYPYVLCPNSWMYDMRNQSWWQLHQGGRTNDSPSYSTYVIDALGKVYGMPWYRDASQRHNWIVLDPSQQLSLMPWSARTHVISEVLGPQSASNVREIEAVISGEGSVQFTVTNENGTATVTFNTTGNYTHTFRADIVLKTASASSGSLSPGASGTFVDMLGSGQFNGTPGPTVHEFTLYVDDGRTIGAT